MVSAAELLDLEMRGAVLAGGPLGTAWQEISEGTAGAAPGALRTCTPRGTWVWPLGTGKHHGGRGLLRN